MLVDGHQQEVDVGIGHDRTAPEISKMCAASDPNCVSPRSAYTTVYVLEHGSYDREPVTKVLLVPHTGDKQNLAFNMITVTAQNIQILISEISTINVTIN